VLWEDNVAASDVHHGGALAFGADGMLYFTTGDHLVPQDSQSLTNNHGKLMRINPDGSIPADNPFFDGGGPNRDTIWAYGLRNPFRISVDPVTGTMYVADVGGNADTTAIEEVNVAVRGANYGWPLGEGDSGVPGTTAPLYSYPHNGRDAAITGGFVYRGNQFPAEYYGSYIFGDYAQNTLRRLTFDGNGQLMGAVNFWPTDGTADGPTVGDPVKIIPGPDGSLYYVDIGFDEDFNPNASAIRRIRYTLGNQPPIVVANVNPSSGLPPLAANFSSVGTFDPEGQAISYAWDFGDGNASTEANPTHVYASAGRYFARLTVSDGVSSTLSSALVVSVGHVAPATSSAMWVARSTKKTERCLRAHFRGQLRFITTPTFIRPAVHSAALRRDHSPSQRRGTTFKEIPGTRSYSPSRTRPVWWGPRRRPCIQKRSTSRSIRFQRG
jgi:hypothetical protein